MKYTQTIKVLAQSALIFCAFVGALTAASLFVRGALHISQVADFATTYPMTGVMGGFFGIALGGIFGIMHAVDYGKD
jgi:hypothetical protein